MSKIVHYKGKLIKIKKLENETLEEQCKRILEGDELYEAFDSYVEILDDEFVKQYFIYKNELYRVTSLYFMNVVTCGEIIKIDDKLNFELRYSNGGCGFNEALQMALELHNKSKILWGRGNT